MKGTVIKRGSKWSVVIDVGRDADGKRIRRWHSGYERRREAEAARVEILNRLQSGICVSPTKITVAEFLSQWLTNRSNLAETTLATYRHEVKRIVRALGPIRLLDLQPIAIADMYQALIASGLSPKSVRNTHAILHRALRDATRQGLVPRNASEGIELPRPRRPTTRAWTMEELRTFLERIETDRLFAAWLLAVSTGMRRSELLGLRWQNVDLERARLSVVDSLVMVDNRPTLRLGETKTGGSRRQIALDRRSVTELAAHRRRQVEERLSAGPAYEDNDLVFASQTGQPVNPDWFTRATKSRAAAAGVTPLSPHSAGRHTWATLALEEGIHPKVVAERLGHASVSTTLDRYSHVIESIDREAAETVATAIGRGRL